MEIIGDNEVVEKRPISCLKSEGFGLMNAVDANTTEMATKRVKETFLRFMSCKKLCIGWIRYLYSRGD